VAAERFVVRRPEHGGANTAEPHERSRFFAGLRIDDTNRLPGPVGLGRVDVVRDDRRELVVHEQGARRANRRLREVVEWDHSIALVDGVHRHDGTLRILHHDDKKKLARVLAAGADETGHFLEGFGSWTLKNEKKKTAGEPDGVTSSRDADSDPRSLAPRTRLSTAEPRCRIRSVRRIAHLGVAVAIGTLPFTLACHELDCGYGGPGCGASALEGVCGGILPRGVETRVRFVFGDDTGAHEANVTSCSFDATALDLRRLTAGSFSLIGLALGPQQLACNIDGWSAPQLFPFTVSTAGEVRDGSAHDASPEDAGRTCASVTGRNLAR
jgi:hypothetical protein